MSYLEEAREKLRKELPAIKGQKEGAIKHAVMDALLNFAEQDGEFAQAIVQGGDFANCMHAVCKGIGTSISDLDAYGRAASFYFPGCKVRFEMHIDLVGDAAGEADCHANAAALARNDREGEPEKKAGLVFNLADFL